MKRLILLALSLCLISSQPCFADYYKSDYNEAIRVSKLKKEKLVLLISADWCSPCQAQKRLLERLQKEGKLPKDVHIAFIKYDSALAKKIKVGDSVPQLIKYTYKEGKWSKKASIGYLSTPKLLEYLKNG